MRATRSACSRRPTRSSSQQERELDLVEVAPEARPPVGACSTTRSTVRAGPEGQAGAQAPAADHGAQIKFRPKIAEHDYDTKKHHVERFLKHKDRSKVTIMFRGREVTHPERGTMILDRLAEELSELGVVEQRPMQEGRNMTMMMAPSKAVLAGRLGELGRRSPRGRVARDRDEGEQTPANGVKDARQEPPPEAPDQPAPAAEPQGEAVAPDPRGSRSGPPPTRGPPAAGTAVP